MINYSEWMRIHIDTVFKRYNRTAGCALQINVLRAVDPDSLNPDTDPAFQVNPDLDSGFWWPKTEEKKSSRNFFNLLLSNLQEKPSAPKIENIQHFKKWNVLTFSMFVGHFCPPGSGSDCESWYGSREQRPHWIRIQSGYGSGSTSLNVLHNTVSAHNYRTQQPDIFLKQVYVRIVYLKSQFPSFYIFTLKLIFATLKWKMMCTVPYLACWPLYRWSADMHPTTRINYLFQKGDISNLSFSFERLFTFPITN